MSDWRARVLDNEPQEATLTKMHRLLHLLATGVSHQDILADLDVDQARLWQLKNHTVFKRMWEQFLESARSGIKDDFMRRSSAAGERIEDLAKQNVNLRVKLSANQDILDRAGFRPKQEVESTYVLRIERETLDAISAAARESGVIGAGPAPRILEAHVAPEPLFPDESDPRQTEIDWPPPPRDGGLRPDARPEDPDASAAWPLQDNDRIGGLPDLAPHR